MVGPRARSSLRGLLGLVLAVAACDSPTARVAPVAPTLTNFALLKSDNPELPTDVVGTIRNDTVDVVVPSVVSVTALIPTFTLDDTSATATIGGTTQQSGVTPRDFTPNLTLRITAANGLPRDYVISVRLFTGTPIVTIATQGGVPILDRENYVPATVTVFGGKDHLDWSFTAPTGIRGRGTSTWDNPKKPYRLKLNTSASVLGFPADRDWILLANYWDQTLARNALAFALASMTGSASYIPRCTPVEVILNSQHLGAYQLCDHLEVATARVPATSQGWFVELTALLRVKETESFVHSPALDAWGAEAGIAPSVWVFKQPDPPSDAQRAGVAADIARMEEVLYGAGFTHPDTGYAKYLDVDAAIDWYLVQELAKNNDAAFHNSVYAYKVPAQKIVIGPVWDFDLAFGNYPWDFEPTGWKIRDAAWYRRLFQDPAFIARVKARWQALYARRAEVDRFIVEYTGRLDVSQRLTHAMWAPYGALPTLRAGGSALAFTDADYASEVAELRTWLNARWDWLNANLMGL